MRKTTVLITLILLTTALIVKSQTATPPSVGNGTIGNPYEIATLNNLYWISQNIAEWDKHYIQTVNIDATTTNTWDNGAGFSPIGNDSIKFTGSYNGKSHTINGLYIDRPNEYEIGLFGVTIAYIDSLGLTNVDIVGRGSVGALAGFNEGSSILNYCYSTGTVHGEDGIGGLVGDSDALIINCYSSVAVSAIGSYIGGLAGSNYSTINNSYSTGSVTTNDVAGGLVGENGSIINNSYSTATVTGTSGYHGGLVGRNYASISNSYSTGLVSGSSGAGGLVGKGNGGTTSNSFWDTGTSGQTISDGGTGKTTAEMQTMCMYLDSIEAYWDFIAENNNGTDNIWGMNSSENGGYPFLEWQGYTQTESCCGYVDSENPTITCVGDQVKALTSGQSQYTVSGTEFDPIATGDNCAVASTINDFNSSATLDAAVIPIGTTTVIWKVTDDSGNEDTCSFEIQVNAFVGLINTVLENKISLFPNPAYNQLSIVNDQLPINKVQIIDVTGKVVLSATSIDMKKSIEINVSILKDGIYFVKITTNSSTEVLRFIKR